MRKSFYILFMSLMFLSFSCGETRPEIRENPVQEETPVINKGPEKGEHSDGTAIVIDNYSAYHLAVLSENQKMINNLIIDGSNINETNSDGLSALDLALLSGKSLKLVKTLIEGGAGFTPKDDVIPVQEAVIGGNIELLIYLAEMGADLTVADSIGNTLLHSVDMKSVNAIEMLAYLTEKGLDINALNNNDKTVLMNAAITGNKSAVILLIDSGADVNSGFISPLHLAADFGYLEIATILLESGANVNAINPDKLTPLHIAAWKGRTEIVELLLSYSAQIDVKGRYHTTPFYLACHWGHTDTAAVLLKNGADITQGPVLPIYAAIDRGYLDTVQFLITNGADINVYGLTENHLSLWSGESNQLMDSETEIDPNQTDSFGRTPLHYAALSGNEQSVSYLIERNADTQLTDKNGHTPADLASYAGYTNITALLKQ